MLPDQVSNPGSLTYESGALPIALRGPATLQHSEAKVFCFLDNYNFFFGFPLNVQNFFDS